MLGGTPEFGWMESINLLSQGAGVIAHPHKINAAGCDYAQRRDSVLRYNTLFGSSILPSMDFAVTIHEIKTAGTIVVARWQINPAIRAHAVNHPAVVNASGVFVHQHP